MKCLSSLELPFWQSSMFYWKLSKKSAFASSISYLEKLRLVYPTGDNQSIAPALKPPVHYLLAPGIQGRHLPNAIEPCTLTYSYSYSASYNPLPHLRVRIFLTYEISPDWNTWESFLAYRVGWNRGRASCLGLLASTRESSYKVG